MRTTIRIFAAIAVTATTLTGTPVLAASCTSTEAECIGSGGPQSGDLESKRRQCQVATRECKARCAQGTKVYISPFTGRSYVVDSCK